MPDAFAASLQPPRMALHRARHHRPAARRRRPSSSADARLRRRGAVARLDRRHRRAELLHTPATDSSKRRSAPAGAGVLAFAPGLRPRLPRRQAGRAPGRRAGPPFVRRADRPRARRPASAPSRADRRDLALSRANLVYDTLWGRGARRGPWMAESRTYPVARCERRAISRLRRGAARPPPGGAPSEPEPRTRHDGSASTTRWRGRSAPSSRPIRRG